MAEIFDYVGRSSEIPAELLNQRTIFPPLIIDSYALLEKAAEGNWGLSGHLSDYVPSARVRGVKFAWGVKGQQSLTDINNQHTPVSDDEAAKWPECSPSGDWDVKNYLNQNGSRLGA